MVKKPEKELESWTARKARQIRSYKARFVSQTRKEAVCIAPKWWQEAKHGGDITRLIQAARLGTEHRREGVDGHRSRYLSHAKRMLYRLSTVGIEGMCLSMHARACKALKQDMTSLWAWSQAEAQGNLSRYDGLAMTWLPGMRFSNICMKIV